MLSCRQPLRSTHLASWTLRPHLSGIGCCCGSCVKQAAGLQSMTDPGVLYCSSKTEETNRLPSCNSQWRYGFGCCCFHFTPLQWTYQNHSSRHTHHLKCSPWLFFSIQAIDLHRFLYLASLSSKISSNQSYIFSRLSPQTCIFFQLVCLPLSPPAQLLTVFLCFSSPSPA